MSFLQIRLLRFAIVLTKQMPAYLFQNLDSYQPHCDGLRERKKKIRGRENAECRSIRDDDFYRSIMRYEPQQNAGELTNPSHPSSSKQPLFWPRPEHLHALGNGNNVFQKLVFLLFNRETFIARGLGFTRNTSYLGNSKPRSPNFAKTTRERVTARDPATSTQ